MEEYKTAEEIINDLYPMQSHIVKYIVKKCMKQYATQEITKHLKIASLNADIEYKTASGEEFDKLYDDEEWDLSNNGEFFRIRKSSITDIEINLTH